MHLFLPRQFSYSRVLTPFVFDKDAQQLACMVNENEKRLEWKQTSGRDSIVSGRCQYQAMPARYLPQS